MPVTTTTAIGRGGNLVYPDLGYQGGAGLHSLVETMFTELSNNQAVRWDNAITLADTATTTITHNFGAPFAELQFVVVESGVRISAKDQLENYSFAQIDTNSYQIQNTSGGSKTFDIYTYAVNFEKMIGLQRGYVTTADAVSTIAMTIPTTLNTTFMIDIKVVGKIDTTTACAYSILAMVENSSNALTITEMSRTELEDDTALAVTLQGSGSDFRVRVTGKAATSIDWTVITR